MTKIKQIHIHHTAGTNEYTEADVPALLRGIYRYHTHNLGWSDVGYNYLVDRFGGIWEGRAGGVDRGVQGAHTRGFNTTSAGVAVIGNFDLTRPKDNVINSLAHIAAWKLAPTQGHPRGLTNVISEGSDRYGVGARVRLHVIDGHKDTNDTACPGSHLYAALPNIRRRARSIMLNGGQSSLAIVTPPILAGTPEVGETLTVVPGTYQPAQAAESYTWLRNGAPIGGVAGATYLCTPADLGTQLSVQVEATKPGLGAVTQLLGPTAAVLAVVTPDIQIRRVNSGFNVRVRLVAPTGVTVPISGQVRIRIRRRTITATVVDGAAVARFRRPRSGAHRVEVTYLGDASFKAVTATSPIPQREIHPST